MVPLLAAIEMRSTRSCSARLLASAALLAFVAAATAGCQTTQSTETTGALPLASAEHPEADGRRDVDVYGQQYRANPTNRDVALRYAQALRATGQRAQAVAVLERASLENPRDKAVLGAYGRALAEAGDYNQALEVLGPRPYAGPAGLAHSLRAGRRARPNGPSCRGATLLPDRAQDRSR